MDMLKGEPEEPKREILSEKNNINYDTTQYSYANEKVIEDIKLPPTYHRKRENKADIEENISSKKTKCETNDPNAENLQLRNNSENFSFEFFPPSDNINKELEDNDEEIKFDLKNISIELKREPKAKWEVGCTCITDRFRQYQKDILKKAQREGLKYDNIYELLHLVGGDVFMDSVKSQLNRIVASMFNNLYYSIPEVAPSKLSEEEHCDMFIYPITRSFHRPEKEYELGLNRATARSKTRPDLSCLVNGVAILNSEFKPLGFTPLQGKKDRLKAQLKGRKSINQQLERKGGPGESAIFLNLGDSMESFIMDLKFDGLYRSWLFLKTKVVVDKSAIPLAEFAISHFVALENFKYRSDQFTPPTQMSYIRKLPDTPQEKDTAHDGFDFSDVPSYADAKLIQEEESLSKLETVYQHYLMKKLDIFVSKYPSMQLKHVDTHQKPILKGQKPDIIFYLQDRAISNINIVSVLEIKVTEKEDEWVKATSLAESQGGNRDLTTCHHIQFIKAVLTENNDTYFYITGILPFRKVGSHYLAHFCLSTSELLGFSLPTIKYQEKIFEATEILGTGATSTAYLLGNDYVLKNDMISRRYPYQLGKDIQKGINTNHIAFADKHLSEFPLDLVSGYYTLEKKGTTIEKLDVVIVEATAITEEGHIIPGASVGATPEIVQSAAHVVIEVNTALPNFEGLHDITLSKFAPYKFPILVQRVDDRVGTPYIPCDSDKVIAVIESTVLDRTTDSEPQDATSHKIANNILEFLEHEVSMDRLPKQLLPLQSGVGNIANAVIGGLADGPFTDVEVWTEVIQDTFLDFWEHHKLSFASATSVAFSPTGFKRFYEMWDYLKDRLVLRSQSVSNSPEVIRRLGVIAMNTPVDIYAHSNSTHVCGTRMLNGLGGSSDFLRNSKLSIMHTPSTRPTKKDPIGISCVVPMYVIVTEHGLADIRGLSPVERAKMIIDKCVHPDYRDILKDYFEISEKKCLKIGAAHQPHMLDKVFKMHLNVMGEENTMRIKSWD
ncbi:14349_t:CDS:10 [Entrophospora sp. SA101]|nr:14349_t:CDS:10 [Entrophospora sp. SA101]